MEGSSGTRSAARGRRVELVSTVRRHGWLIGLLAAGFIAPWIVR